MARKRTQRKKDKAQTLSFDVLIAIGVFIAAAIFLLYLLSQPSRPATLEELVEEGEQISAQLISPSDPGSSDSTAVVVSNKLDRQRLNALASMDYNQLKSLLGVKGDFCIHFEDEAGNLVDIDSRPDVTLYSIGSKNLNFTVINQESNSEMVLTCGVPS